MSEQDQEILTPTDTAGPSFNIISQPVQQIPTTIISTQTTIPTITMDSMKNTIEKQIQSRFHSKFAWVTAFSLTAFFLKTYFNYEIPHADQLVNYILATATMFGVFNNPTDKKNY